MGLLGSIPNLDNFYGQLEASDMFSSLIYQLEQPKLFYNVKNAYN